MPIAPDPPFPKTQGDNIRSKDWNDAVNEIIRLDNAKANRNDAETFAGPLTINGNVGIGIGGNAPAENLHTGSRVRAGNLTIGEWPANANYQMVGASTLDQSTGGNYALLQSAAGGDLGTTFVNSPETVRLRIGNMDRATLEKDGSFTLGASNNPLRFTSGWTAFTETGTNRAEISNDTGGYKTLMIVGNRSAGGNRRVSVWDRLEVNGDLFVTGRIGSFGKPTSPLTPGWGGGLRTWDIEAEGTIWSRGNFQSGARDLAEVYFSDIELEPGDVVSLDPDLERIVRAEGPNDTAVIGIVSTEPGLLLNSQLNLPARSDGSRGYPVALCGCVPCKVSAENGPIRRGDLLTPASKRGFAMRAESVRVEGKSLFAGGSLIGKALAAHAEGEGEIEVYVIVR